MHYTVREDLVEQVAKRMNPEKYSWNARNRADLRMAASELITFIEAYQRAAELQEKVSDERASQPKTALGVAGSELLQKIAGQQIGTGKGILMPRPPQRYPHHEVVCINAGSNDGGPKVGYSLADPYQPRPDRPYDTRVNTTTGYVGVVGAQRDEDAQAQSDR